jgi:hypothetical protein
MMNPRLTRLSLRLIVPMIALSAVIAAGEPLPARTGTVAMQEAAFALALQEEATELRLEAEAAKKAASRSASQMRWFLTLPAAGNHRSSNAPARSNAG